MNLSELHIGASAIVKTVTTDESMKRRLWDLGFTKGTKVTAVQKSPGGDPIAYRIRGTIFAIRNKEAEKIVISEVCHDGSTTSF